MYQARIEIKHSIQLNADDFLELEKIISRESASKDNIREKFTFEVESEDMLIRKDSLADLLNTESLPDDCKTVRISYAVYNTEKIGNDADKSIYINLLNSYSYKDVYIKGISETWVKGMKEVLTKFFNKKKVNHKKEKFSNFLFYFINFTGGGLIAISLISDNYFLLGITILLILSSLILSYPKYKKKILPPLRVTFSLNTDKKTMNIPFVSLIVLGSCAVVNSIVGLIMFIIKLNEI